MKAGVTAASSTDTLALAEALRDVVGRLVRSVRNHSGTQSTAQSETLAFLERSGPISIAALAEGRGVKHQSMRLVVAKLEERGLLARRTDPNDRRGYLVTLTEAGFAAMAANRLARASWLADALSTTMSTGELAVLGNAVSLLQRLTKEAGARAPDLGDAGGA